MAFFQWSWWRKNVLFLHLIILPVEGNLSLPPHRQNPLWQLHQGRQSLLLLQVQVLAEIFIHTLFSLSWWKLTWAVTMPKQIKRLTANAKTILKDDIFNSKEYAMNWNTQHSIFVYNAKQLDYSQIKSEQQQLCNSHHDDTWWHKLKGIIMTIRNI